MSMRWADSDSDDNSSDDEGQRMPIQHSGLNDGTIPDANAFAQDGGSGAIMNVQENEAAGANAGADDEAGDSDSDHSSSGDETDDEERERRREAIRKAKEEAAAAAAAAFLGCDPQQVQPFRQQPFRPITIGVLQGSYRGPRRKN